MNIPTSCNINKVTQCRYRFSCFNRHFCRGLSSRYSRLQLHNAALLYWSNLPGSNTAATRCSKHSRICACIAVKWIKNYIHSLNTLQILIYSRILIPVAFLCAFRKAVVLIHGGKGWHLGNLNLLCLPITFVHKYY